jgi:hypothetical protein
MDATPPGLISNLQYYTHGGEEESLWMPYEKIKLYTNVFVINESEGKVCPFKFLIRRKARLGPEKTHSTRLSGSGV